MSEYRFEPEDQVFDRFELIQPILQHPGELELWEARNRETESISLLLFLPPGLSMSDASLDVFSAWLAGYTSEKSSRDGSGCLIPVDFHSGADVAFELSAPSDHPIRTLQEIDPDQLDVKRLCEELPNAISAVHSEGRAQGYFDDRLILAGAGGGSLLLPRGLAQCVFDEYYRLSPEHEFFGDLPDGWKPGTVNRDVVYLARVLAGLPAELPRKTGDVVRKVLAGNPVSVLSFVDGKGDASVDNSVASVSEESAEEATTSLPTESDSIGGGGGEWFSHNRKAVFIGAAVFLVLGVIVSIATRPPKEEGGGGDAIANAEFAIPDDWFADANAFDTGYDPVVEVVEGSEPVGPESTVTNDLTDSGSAPETSTGLAENATGERQGLGQSGTVPENDPATPIGTHSVAEGAEGATKNSDVVGSVPVPAVVSSGENTGGSTTPAVSGSEIASGGAVSRLPAANSSEIVGNSVGGSAPLPSGNGLPEESPSQRVTRPVSPGNNNQTGESSSAKPQVVAQTAGGVDALIAPAPQETDEPPSVAGRVDEADVIAGTAAQDENYLVGNPSVETVLLSSPKPVERGEVLGYSKEPVSNRVWSEVTGSELSNRKADQSKVVRLGDANSFLEALTQKDRASGQIGSEMAYKLPSPSQVKTDQLLTDGDKGGEKPFTFVLVREGRKSNSGTAPRTISQQREEKKKSSPGPNVRERGTKDKPLFVRP